ncbi:hypothetical protein DL766_004883 [Monosporascus sp. MC13-8B]|uniref:NAD-dependent epimerase/dehydratase domain-containing protein n=1 Tax=Monosporascus cannonballus TaxID=155416 RepID=A0ABY0GWI5_9PEZI|nr:hypothetical protein DL762_008577 [Monosporascus cannonballus]RYP00217.1 hypothetical protein DL763_000986 [Monosporascus cannonballus]RYP30405.1 hypothetical protein DL766_004883 [Monosporascus sp. MC13-8B]
MPGSIKVLLTGSTGYIGGSVLSTLLTSKNPAVEHISLSALVRGEDRARLLTEAGVNVELFEDLDQTELLENIASNYDGASNIAILPSSGENLESHVLSDKDSVHAYEKYRESLHSYAQRAAEIAVVETGLATGVRTTVIMPPTIYGTGSGFFNRLSVQIPNVIQTALNRGRAIRVGDHNVVCNYVHIDDLLTFYEMVLARIVAGKEVPYGKNGILFTDGGEFAWTELYEGAAKALKKRGKLATEELQTLSLKEAAEIFTGGDEYSVEAGFASTARARGDIGREWGWEPRKTHSDFLNTFEVEADAVLETGKSLNYTSHPKGH